MFYELIVLLRNIFFCNGYDMPPIYFTLSQVGCNFLIPTHWHLWMLSVTSLIMISFSANHHKAFISFHVKIYTMLPENTKCILKNCSLHFWQSHLAKPTLSILFTLFLQNTCFWTPILIHLLHLVRSVTVWPQKSS